MKSPWPDHLDLARGREEGAHDESPCHEEEGYTRVATSLASRLFEDVERAAGV
jgi:hypothetical protein